MEVDDWLLIFIQNAVNNWRQNSWIWQLLQTVSFNVFDWVFTLRNCFKDLLSHLRWDCTVIDQLNHAGQVSWCQSSLFQINLLLVQEGVNVTHQVVSWTLWISTLSNRCVKEVSHGQRLRQHFWVVHFQTKFINVTGLTFSCWFWQLSTHFFNPFVRDVNWCQIWFWEVTVIISRFLLTHQNSFTRCFIETTCLLLDCATSHVNLSVTLFFERQSLTNIVEWVQVLQLDLSSVFLRTNWANWDVGVNTHWTFLHLNVWNTRKLDSLAQSFKVCVGLIWWWNVRCTNDFDQWRSLTVQVNVWVTIRPVGVLTSVFFDVKFSNTDTLLLTLKLDFQPTVTANWLLLLRDLVSLWIIWVEVVLTIPVQVTRYISIQSQSGHHTVFQRTLVCLWQTTRVTPVNNVRVGVRLSTVLNWWRWHCLWVGLQLNVDFKSDCRFKVRHSHYLLPPGTCSNKRVACSYAYAAR